jgi:hypothetical protein
LQLELLKELFPQGEFNDRMSLIKTEFYQGSILNELANACVQEELAKSTAYWEKTDEYEERIQNGYWIAYQIAEALEK